MPSIRNIRNYDITKLDVTHGRPLIKDISRPPLLGKHVVHLIVDTGFGLDKSALRKRFTEEANFSKYKTFVSFGKEAFKRFLEGKNYTEDLFNLTKQANDWKELFDKLEKDIQELKANHERTFDQMQDQGDLTDKFNALLIEQEKAMELEDRLLSNPDYVVTALPLVVKTPIRENNEHIKIMLDHYLANPCISIINIYNAEGRVMELFEAVQISLDCVCNNIGHSLILENGKKRQGFIFNKTLTKSLRLVSFIKSVFPSIDLLLIVDPSLKTENEAGNRLQNALDEQVKAVLSRLGVKEEDIVEKNGKSEPVENAIGTKVQRFLSTSEGEG